MSYQALNWAVKQRVGTPVGKGILMALANYADEKGTCFPSHERISRETELSDKSVRIHLKRLEQLGVLATEHQRDEAGRHGLIRYCLALDHVFDIASEDTRAGRKEKNIPQHIAVNEEETTPFDVQRHGAPVEKPPVNQGETPPVPGATESLSKRTLDSRENARVREEEQFQALLAVYPPGAIGNVEAARTVFAGLDAEHQAASIEAVPRARAGWRKEGRSFPFALSTYLKNADWTRFPKPTDADGKPVDEKITIGPYSRGAWALFARQYRGGKTVANTLSWIRSGADVPVGTAPTETEMADLVTVGVGSPEHVAWREHCKRLGFDLPMPDKVEFIFLPSKNPPELSMNWKGYTLIEPVAVEIRGRAWWWRIYQPKAPIADLVAERSVGTRSLTMGPIPLPAEIDEMVEIEIGSVEFEEWDLWFRRQGVTLFALQGAVWAPSKHPSALHEPLDPVPDYEAIESVMAGRHG